MCICDVFCVRGKAWNFLQLLVLQWWWKDFLTGVFFVLSCIVFGVALLWEMDVACSASTPYIFDWWLLDLMLCNSLLRMIIGLWVGILMYSFLCWSLPAHFYFAFMQMYFDLVLSSQVHLCLFSCVRGLAPEHSFWVSLGRKNSSERQKCFSHFLCILLLGHSVYQQRVVDCQRAS